MLSYKVWLPLSITAVAGSVILDNYIGIIAKT